MRDEPESLPRELLAGSLRQHWGIDVTGVEYAPVGFGSYHWVVDERGGGRWFVTADYLDPAGERHAHAADTALGDLRAAYETAASLRDRGLSFVVAPVADNAGELVIQVGLEWAVAIFPFIEGSSTSYGEWPDAEARVRAAEMAGQIHISPPPSMVQRWDFAIQGRSVLFEAMGDLGRRWNSGPYGDRTRELLADSRPGIAALFQRYDRRASDLAASPEPWVLTHGEPHSANFINVTDGQMYLIDWDTVRLAPRERDLEMVVGDDAEALTAYQRVAGPAVPRPDAVVLFRLRWALDEICIFVQRFRGPHTDSLDSQKSWMELRQYLSKESRWLKLV